MNGYIWMYSLTRIWYPFNSHLKKIWYLVCVYLGKNANVPKDSARLMRKFYFLIWTILIIILRDKTVNMIYFYTTDKIKNDGREFYKWKHITLEAFQKFATWSTNELPLRKLSIRQYLENIFQGSRLFYYPNQSVWMVKIYGLISSFIHVCSRQHGLLNVEYHNGPL